MQEPGDERLGRAHALRPFASVSGKPIESAQVGGNGLAACGAGRLRGADLVAEGDHIARGSRRPGSAASTRGRGVDRVLPHGVASTTSPAARERIGDRADRSKAQAAVSTLLGKLNPCAAGALIASTTAGGAGMHAPSRKRSASERLSRLWPGRRLSPRQGRSPHAPFRVCVYPATRGQRAVDRIRRDQQVR